MLEPEPPLTVWVTTAAAAHGAPIWPAHNEADLVNSNWPAVTAGPGLVVRQGMNAVIRIETSSPGNSTPSLAT
jgi:hypothetical protein